MKREAGWTSFLIVLCVTITWAADQSFTSLRPQMTADGVSEPLRDINAKGVYASSEILSNMITLNAKSNITGNVNLNPTNRILVDANITNASVEVNDEGMSNLTVTASANRATIGNSASNQITTLTTQNATVGNSASNLVIAQTTQDATIGNSASNLVIALTTQNATVGNNLSNQLDTLAVTVGGGTSNLLVTANTQAATVGNNLSNQLATLTTQAATVGDGSSNILLTINANANTVGNSLSNLLTSTGDGISNKVLTANADANTVGNALSNLVTTIGNGLSNTVAAATNGNVGGFTLVTNATLIVDSTAAGIVANDILAPQVEIANAVRTAGGTGILKCLTIGTGDNNAPAIRLLIASQPITWGDTNAVANLTMSEAAYMLGMVDFAVSDFKLIGTNYFATKDVSVGIKPATNSLFIYAVCTAAITNTNSATVKLTILQD